MGIVKCNLEKTGESHGIWLERENIPVFGSQWRSKPLGFGAGDAALVRLDLHQDDVRTDAADAVPGNDKVVLPPKETKKRQGPGTTRARTFPSGSWTSTSETNPRRRPSVILMTSLHRSSVTLVPMARLLLLCFLVESFLLNHMPTRRRLCQTSALRASGEAKLRLNRSTMRASTYGPAHRRARLPGRAAGTHVKSDMVVSARQKQGMCSFFRPMKSRLLIQKAA